ncbi:kinetochore protein SPC24 homolog [Humulus lupulus]|uniref:kinetochore protein SPC24 homolog n=1 Tax=Humulus lupulus TaxID=3486 RepID=UPI002B40216F|nr:kinetochore protein SPC24 homolog [Humulus lupulus]XP_062095028.1 kinetochore protein SPC24 homolog [Humulus lupulus]
MGDLSKNIDSEKSISYCDDMIRVLKDKREIDVLMQSFDNVKILQSSSLADFNEVQNMLQDYEGKIAACKQKTEAAKSEVVSDEELDLLNKELEEERDRECLLLEELRVITKEIDELERERITIQEKTQILRESKQDERRAERTLSMFASVTNIIPDLYDPSKVSGHIVDRDKKLVKQFEFDQEQMIPFDTCDSIWKMIGS